MRDQPNNFSVGIHQSLLKMQRGLTTELTCPIIVQVFGCVVFAAYPCWSVSGYTWTRLCFQ